MKKAHFIGISGIGMSAVAKLLKDAGWEVSGSDGGFYPPASTYLEAHNIPLSKGYRAENIPEDVEMIVIGKNAKLTEKNEEVKAAFESGKTIRSYPEVLGSLFNETKNIVVAGSYGKSTCTAIMSFVLEHAGKHPGYFIGAVPLNTGETAHVGASDIAVLEGDEYPSANWDNTSKFLYYHPHDVLLTSAEHDHVNVFPTHAEYLMPFKTLLSIMPEDGLLVASADDESALALAHTHPGKKVLYGLKNQEQKSYDISYDFWSASDMHFGENTTFTLTKNGKPVTEIETSLLGEHNIENILGVSAMLLEKQLVTPEELRSALLNFKGMKRRLDLLSPHSTVRVYEGFGSSHEKAQAAIEAMKLHFPDKRLIVVFEPHTFSLRNKAMLHWYDNMFRGSDLVLIYEPATQGADTHKQLTQEEIVERVEETGIDVRPVHTASDALSILKKELHKDDVVLLSTSGDLGGLINQIPKWTEEAFPQQ